MTGAMKSGDRRPPLMPRDGSGTRPAGADLLGVEHHYAVEDGTGVIEIQLNTVEQLFNSLDPAPFHAKDLDADAEEYIVGAIDDFPLSAPLKLVFYLPADQATPAQAENVRGAIHNYFAYRLSAGRRQLRFLLREGRFSLLIGIAFLVACFSLRQLVQALGSGTLTDILAEGLLISGWVAMWRPIQIFLYGWWPHRHMSRIFAKITSMPVEIRATS